MFFLAQIALQPCRPAKSAGETEGLLPGLGIADVFRCSIPDRPNVPHENDCSTMERVGPPWSCRPVTVSGNLHGRHGENVESDGVPRQEPVTRCKTAPISGVYTTT